MTRQYKLLDIIDIFILFYIIRFTKDNFNHLCACNHIALRKAKIAYNFGLSECNRVNLVLFFISNTVFMRSNGPVSDFGQRTEYICNIYCNTHRHSVAFATRIIYLERVVEVFTFDDNMLTI